MVKIVISLVVFIFAIQGIQAQEFSFGLKAGANISNIRGYDSNGYNWDYNSKLGFHGGLVVQTQISERFGIQSEVLYSMQGANDGSDPFYDVDFETQEVKLNLEYINVPVLAEYQIVPGFSAQLGPQIGFLIYPEQEVEYTYMGEDRKQDSSLNNFTKTTDFSLAAGLEYSFDMGLFFDARYNYGLTTFSENIGGGVLPDGKNSVIQFAVGYMF